MGAYVTKYPSAYDDAHVKATSKFSTSYEPWFAFDPSLSLTGTYSGTEWLTSSVTNQKLSVNLDSQCVISRIIINNGHLSGGSTTQGIKNIILYGSNSATAFANTTYADTTDLVQLGAFVVAPHAAADAPDPQTFDFTNSTAYQYYVLRIADNNGSASYMSVRNIELQEYDASAIGYIDVLPSPIDNTTVFATTEYSGYPASNGADPASTDDWYSETSPSTANQKFVIDFGTAFVAGRLVLENSHSFTVDRGIYHFAVYGSNSAAAVTNVGDFANDTDLVLLESGLVADDYTTANTQYFTINNTVSYRYYVLKITDNHGGNLLGFRQATFQIVDAPVSVSHLVSMDMPYGDDIVSLLRVMDMPYSLRLMLQCGMLYGIRLGCVSDHYYGDASVLLAPSAQYYGDAARLQRSCTMEYTDMLPLRHVSEQQYDILKPLMAITEARYGINGDVLRKIMDLQYDLSQYDLLLKKMDMPYLLQSAVGALAVSSSLTIAGVAVDFVHISVECNRSSFVITGEAHLADIAQYIQIRRGDAVELVCNETTYTLIVESKKRSRPGGAATTFIVNLVSPAMMLSAPWSAVLQQEFTPDTAENIINDLLGDLSPCDYQTVTFPVLADTLYANGEDARSVIRKINKSVGAVMQSDPDGTVRMEPEYPQGWNSEENVSYYLTDERNFISQDESPAQKSGENKYLVGNASSASERIWTEQRTLTPSEVEVLGFQVPWGKKQVQGLTHSGGSSIAVPEYMGIIEETYPPADADAEQLEFVAGFATAAHPVYGDLQVEWLRESLGAITYAEDGKLEAELKTGDTDGYSLAAVRYTTRYHKWIVRDDAAESVQYILWVEDGQ